MSTIFLVAFFIGIVSDLLRALRFKLGKVNLRACSQINIWGKRNAASAKSSCGIIALPRMGAADPDPEGERAGAGG